MNGDIIIVDRIIRKLIRIEELLYTLNYRSNRTMATLDQLKTDVANLTSHITAKAGEIAATLKDLQDQIAALTAGAVSQADLDALDTSVQNAVTQVDALGSPPAPTPDSGGGEVPPPPPPK